jgi:7-cyano-7-deazaguanine synthase
LYLSRKKGNANGALTLRFHRIARGEITAAKRIARTGGVEEHRFVSVPQLRELSDMDIGKRLAGLPPTYIPMKNAIYYSLAAAYAEEAGASCIVGGHNRDDLALFDDVSDEFFAQLQKTLRIGSGRLREMRLRIWRPLRAMPKSEVVALAHRLGVPFEYTWSCHREGDRHCWECEGCRARMESFVRAGIADPLRQKSTENV